jgi:hypothetical protein
MPIKDENGFELFEHDPVTGRSVWHYFDGQKHVWRTDYPVQNLIDQNAESRAQTAGQRHGDWSRVGAVPLNVAWDSGLVEAFDQHDDKFISRFLNDGDNRAWRTREGTV